MRPVTSPARGVAAPVSLLTAERLKDPVAGYALNPPPHEVGDPQRPELLVGVDVVLVLRGEGPGDGDGLHEPDDGAQDGRGDEPPHVVAVERAPPGKRLPGQA